MSHIDNHFGLYYIGTEQGAGCQQKHITIGRNKTHEKQTRFI